jgi:hypothetical protein
MATQRLFLGFISQPLSHGVPEAVVRNRVGHVDPSILRLDTDISQATSTAYLEKSRPRLTALTRVRLPHADGARQELRLIARAYPVMPRITCSTGFRAPRGNQMNGTAQNKGPQRVTLGAFEKDGEAGIRTLGSA